MDKRVFILILAAVLPVGGAGDSTLDRATLHGIQSVNVVIDNVAPELQKEGATAGVLRTRLEEKLRDAGISVDGKSAEFVGLRLTSVHAARGPYAVAATIGLYQPVLLARDHNVKTATQTWEVETVALADGKQVFRACMDSVDDLAGRFVAAYRSVNGETRSRGQ